MTIIEARGRGGQLIERFRCSKPVISIGRAFDNDIILEDEYISAHHVRLSSLARGWEVEDAGSLNGLRVKSHHSTNEVLHSGDELRIGHTTLHIYDEHHPVEAALELDGAEARLSSLGMHSVWLILAAISLTVSVVIVYWNTFDEFKPLNVLEPILTSAFGTLLVAAFWALMGRLLRHKAYFFAHLSLWLIFGLLGVIVLFIAQWAGYNTNSAQLEKGLLEGMSFFISVFAIWGSFTLATNLRNSRRLYSAVGVALVLLSIGLAGEFRLNREFSGYPTYYAQLKHPALLLARPVEEGQLLAILPELFDRADAEIEDDESTEKVESPLQ